MGDKIENLNKENFWNDLYEKYPDAMKVFCEWIDAYKIKNDWLFMFNIGRGYRTSKGEYPNAPKFYDIPLAMQIGIWIEFVTEQYAGEFEWEIKDLTELDWRKEITDYLKDSQKDIEKAG